MLYVIVGVVAFVAGAYVGSLVAARRAVKESMEGFRFLTAVSQNRPVDANDILLAFDPHRRVERETYRRTMERRSRDSGRSLDDTPPG